MAPTSTRESCTRSAAAAFLAKRGEKLTIDRDGKKEPTKIGDAAELAKSIHKDDWNTYEIEADRPDAQAHDQRQADERDDRPRSTNIGRSRAFSHCKCTPVPPMTVSFRKIRLEELDAKKMKKEKGSEEESKGGVIAMAQQTHVLIDAGQSVVRDDVMFGDDGSDGRRSWKLLLRQCRGGRSDGVHVVDARQRRHVDRRAANARHGHLAGEARRQNARLASADARAGQPAFVPLMEPAGLGWLDGFNELLCRCGLESNGPPEFDEAGRLLRPLHGRIANTPAHRVELIVDEDAGLLTLRGVVDESRFHFQSLRLTTSITTRRLQRIHLERRGRKHRRPRCHDADALPLQHRAAAAAGRVHGSRRRLAAVAPLTQVAAKEGVETWNIMPPPRPGSAEQVYVLDLAADNAGETRVLVSGLNERRSRRPAIQQAHPALLHRLAEHAGGERRLCARHRAGDELSESADV